MRHGGRNFRLMALCHGGALLHSKNNTMFITYFKPWAEVIRTRFVATIFKTSSFEHRGILQFVFTKRFAAKKVYVNCGHGVDKRSISVC